MILVVMAAGMGSRFGGMKQLTPVGPNGEFLIDYSIYDAIKAGIAKVVFVIKKEHLQNFRETIGKRIEPRIKVEYAYQSIDDLPVGINKKIERTKPWGTGQALLASRKYVDEAFIIINADDFYGRDAMKTLAQFLKHNTVSNQDKKHYAMVAYQLKNTLSTNGTVSRGICEVESGYLKKVTERTKIGYFNNELAYLEDGQIHKLKEESLVSVNLFGFTPSIFEEANNCFKEFLTTTKDLNTKEFYLPTIVQKLIDDDLIDVRILNTTSKFNGMTYQEDLEGVKEIIKKFIQDGIYPMNLWEEHDEK